MAAASGASGLADVRSSRYRWLQLVLGIVCMTIIANFSMAGPCCQSDRCEISLGSSGYKSRLHGLCIGRDAAGPSRGLVC